MKPKLAIDVNSISNLSNGGRIFPASEILKLYNDEGILIYNSEHGEKPIVFEGDVVLYDANSEEGKKFLEQHKPKE